MGCTPNPANKKLRVQSDHHEFRYKVTIHNPELDHPVEFVQNFQYSAMPLPSLMNLFAFDPVNSREFNANFVSIYNSESRKFQYFVQRLNGLEITNDKSPYLGRLWVPYVNDTKEDWTSVCERELQVTPEDKVEWRHEEYAA